MENRKLPGIVPTAQLRLDVLLGPRTEIVVCELQVRDAMGALVAMRSWPASRYSTTAAILDAAWEGMLQALPPGTWLLDYGESL